MDYSDKILKEYTEHADMRIAFVCRMMVGFMLLVALLNLLGIFKIAPLPLYLTVVISIFDFLLPTLFYNILKIYSDKLRFILLTILVFQSGLQYAALSYHTILMLVFPLIISCLYNERKYVVFTAALSVPMIILSHLAAFQLKIVPDEPLVTLKGTILYGIVPRVIEFFGFFVICYFISHRIQKLVSTLAAKNRELHEEQENLTFSLSQIIENKSENTGQHVRRVSEYTRILCRSLGYDEEECRTISLAATMHDVGKLMIPDTILDKPGRLTPEEFEIVKKHTEYGKKMLETVPGELFTLSTQIAWQHHEKWDGTGYNKVKGVDIPRCARCVALADVFDALVSRRAYKSPWLPEEAFREIVAQKGRQFDPEIVDAFVMHFDEFLEVARKYPDT